MTIRISSFLKRVRDAIRRRETGAVLLALVVLIPFYAILLPVTAAYSTFQEMQRDDQIVDTIADSLLPAARQYRLALGQFENLLDINVDLMSNILGNLMDEEGYYGPRLFDDGVVIEMVDGQPTFPEGTPEDLRLLTTEQLMDMVTEHTHMEFSVTRGAMNLDEPESIDLGFVTDNGKLMCYLTAARINDSLLYLDVTPQYEEMAALESRDYPTEILHAAEQAYGGAVLIVSAADEDLPFVFPSSFFDNVDSAGALGITQSDIDGEALFLFYKDVFYLCTYEYVPDYDCDVIFVYPLNELFLHAVSRTTFIVMTAAIILVSLITYLFSTKDYVKTTPLTKERLEVFHPTALRQRATAMGIAGMLVIAFATSFIQLVSVLQAQSVSGEDTLELVFEKLDEGTKANREATIKLQQDWYIYYAEQIAPLISQYPQLATGENFQDWCSIIGAEYLMLFDGRGRELTCNKDYVGFTLGVGQGDESGDFRKLLKGVPSVAHGLSTDETTGLTCYTVGVTVPSPTSDSNGALVVAIPPAKVFDEKQALKLDDQLKILASKGTLFFAANAKSGEIVHSSDNTLAKKTIEDLGLGKSSLDKGFMGFGNINGERYFILNSDSGDNMHFYAFRVESIFLNTIPCTLVTIICFYFAYRIILSYSLKSYTTKEFDAIVPIEEQDDYEPKAHHVNTERGFRRLASILKDPGSSLFGWETMTPVERTRFVFTLMVCAAMLLVYIFEHFIATRAYLHDSPLLAFILRGNWVKGPNLFAFCSILIISAIAFLFVSTCRWVLKLLSSYLDSKGKTIIRLINNFISYITLAVVIYLSFTYLGFPANTVIGSLGLSGLALTFGARELVADILAGIFIIFEGDYQVGDIVEINGFRGKVHEIGVRATRLRGSDYSIKTFRNSDVRNVTNLSKLNSWYTLEIMVPHTVSLPHVEEVLKRDLSKIHLGPKAISGPIYKGVTSMKGGGMTLAIVTECSERDLEEITIKLNREIRLLFEREGIEMK